ncbi:hypothetical protein NK983_26325, partial [Salmonella enterica subsp. enterica serovar Typhimurium]|nr:hypothetical protein [Salmonella enterica subsp. enterica serovar Typhimurium]
GAVLHFAHEPVGAVPVVLQPHAAFVYLDRPAQRVLTVVRAAVAAHDFGRTVLGICHPRDLSVRIISAACTSSHSARRNQ